eukprot:2891506-Heterocapsa_arctica.AAC.1
MSVGSPDVWLFAEAAPSLERSSFSAASRLSVMMVADACTTAARHAGRDSVRCLWNGQPGKASSRLAMCDG